MRNLGFIAIVLLLTNCTAVELQEKYSYKESKHEILSYAVSVLNDFYPNITKSGSQIANASYYLSRDQDTLATVVNFGQENGFVVFASNDTQLPLIVAQTGSFESYLNIPGISELIDKSLGYENTLTALEPTVPAFMETVTHTIADTLVYPMIQTKWHQNAPFNFFASNSIRKLAGCTPIAIAQVMSYYKYPSELNLTYPNATAHSTTLNWDAMIYHTSSHGTSCDICLQCAYLAREIGHICNAEYMANSTGAWPEVEYLNELGYSSNVLYDYSFNSIINSLNASKPCIISGFSTSAGHTWLIDGYYKKTNLERVYIVSGNLRTLYRTTQDIDTYLHFNYGWQNECADIYILSNRYRQVTDNSTSEEAISSNPITLFDAPSGYNDIRRLLTDIEPLRHL